MIRKTDGSPRPVSLSDLSLAEYVKRQDQRDKTPKDHGDTAQELIGSRSVDTR